MPGRLHSLTIRQPHDREGPWLRVSCCWPLSSSPPAPRPPSPRASSPGSRSSSPSTRTGAPRVTYQARWRTSGTMSGFYFQGEAATPRFRGGEAELPGGRKVPLSITPVEGKRWDVVLAGGERWGPGEATYTFSYDADLAGAGLVAVTRPPDGPPLTVLNWSPVEWDEPARARDARRPLPLGARPARGDAHARGRDRGGPAHRALGQRALPHHLPRRGRPADPLGALPPGPRPRTREPPRAAVPPLRPLRRGRRGRRSGAWRRCATRRRSGAPRPASACGAARPSCSRCSSASAS